MLLYAMGLGFCSKFPFIHGIGGDKQNGYILHLLLENAPNRKIFYQHGNLWFWKCLEFLDGTDCSSKIKTVIS